MVDDIETDPSSTNSTDIENSDREKRRDKTIYSSKCLSHKNQRPEFFTVVLIMTSRN
jgi:hypothetical protein